MTKSSDSMKARCTAFSNSRTFPFHGWADNQASEGADLDFLVGKTGRGVPRDNH